MRSSRKQIICIAILIIVSYIGGYYNDALCSFFVSTHTIDALTAVAIGLLSYTVFHLKCKLVEYKTKYNMRNEWGEVFDSIGRIKSEISNSEARVIEKINNIKQNP